MYMENIKNSHKKNQFKISAPTWNHKVQLPEASISVSDIQDKLQYIITNNETLTDNQ